MQKKFHLVAGLMCLVINIVFPTLMYHYYMQLKSLCETMFDYSDYELMGYGLLAVLFLVWVSSLFIALRELGGWVLQLGDKDYGVKYSW